MAFSAARLARTLPADRFFENRLTVFRPDGARVAAHRYGYESHQHLFDVDLYGDGTVSYAIDCKTVEAPGPFHLAVIEHFRLEIAR
jgi:hypothetical protein